MCLCSPVPGYRSVAGTRLVLAMSGPPGKGGGRQGPSVRAFTLAKHSLAKQSDPWPAF